MKNLFVGIDFSKEKVDVAIVTAEGLREVASRVCSSFLSTASGFRELLKWVKANSSGYETDSWLFCGENTGDYGRKMCNYLYGKGYDVWIENAKSIKDASGLRRLKSDRTDALMIAEYAMRNHDRATLYKPLSESLNQLRELFLYRHMLVSKKASHMTRRSGKEFTQEKSHSLSLIMNSEKSIIKEYERQIEKIDREIESVVSNDEELRQTYEIITSVNGIGMQNAICLMVFTDNFRRFNFNPRKIACYYGVAPFGRDSGTSVHSEPKVHYMANRMIKSMLTQAALIAVRYCPVIAHYYARLIAKGKKKMVALNNVKNKLIHIITAMVRDKQKFNAEYMCAFNS